MYNGAFAEFIPTESTDMINTCIPSKNGSDSGTMCSPLWASHIMS